MNLSAHFTLDEMIVSQEATRRGIDNSPTQQIIDRLTATCGQLEAVRELLGAPLIISSGYRCQQLNALLGGVPTSAHRAGDAVDFIAPSFGPPLAVCQAVQRARIKLDQCIQEGNWTHISFAPTYRREFLTARFGADGKASYSGGIHG